MRVDINEAIQHCLDVAEQQSKGLYDAIALGGISQQEANNCEQCIDDHKQLAVWLMELKDLRGAQNDQCVCFDELMDEHRKLKGIIRQIYKETINYHYGDSLLALKNIEEILDKTGYLWKE